MKHAPGMLHRVPSRKLAPQGATRDAFGVQALHIKARGRVDLGEHIAMTRHSMRQHHSADPDIATAPAVEGLDRM
ncbi:hypothetical protein D3C81_1925730 [compost metagenome]